MAPKFFKIIINPRDHKLRLPTEFMRRHGRNLRDHAFLKAPNGSVRQVQLFHSNGETWLHKGWKEFKEYYSIGFGHLLVFIYDGNSYFDVIIYETTGMEINYPLANVKGAGDPVPETMDIEPESDDSVVFLKEFKHNQKRKYETKNSETADYKGNEGFIGTSEEYSSATQHTKRKGSNDQYLRCSNTLNPAPKPNKGMPNALPRAKQSSRKKASFPDCRDEHVRTSRVKLEECSEGIGNQAEKSVQGAVPKETCIAYQKAKSFKFCYPFYISIMQPSYVSHYFNLSIPSTFAIPYLPEKKNTLKLSGLDGKTWFVQCTIGQFNTKIYRGWKEFVQDNALTVGDVCVFEVNKSDRLVWNVTIFRS